MANAQGTAPLVVDGRTYELRLGFSEIADADQHMGRSILMALQLEPTNFHVIRTLFYFAIRKRSKVRSVEEAGQVLEDADFEAVGEAIQDALKASGLVREAEPSSEGEA